MFIIVLNNWELVFVIKRKLGSPIMSHCSITEGTVSEVLKIFAYMNFL